MVDGTFAVKDNGEQAMIDSFKKLTGINLVLMHPIHNEYYDRVNLAFATGDIPDILILSGNNYTRYAQSGLLVDLTDLYEKSTFKSTIKDPRIIDALKIKGKLFGIPFERGNGSVTYVRGDWLDRLGLKNPTNYQEFLAMLRAFKNRNPDGLSPSQVIPLTAAGLVNTEYPLTMYLPEFYQDATPDYVQVNGTWVDGMLQPNMVAALNRIKAAYDEGLIDKEVFSNKTSTSRDKWNSGRAGVFNYWAGQWGQVLQTNLTPNVPQGKLRPIPAIAETKYPERPAFVYAITTRAKNPQALFHYWHEFVLDGAEGETWANFGPEGIVHRVVDGKIQWLPSIQDPKTPFVKVMVTPEIPVNTWNSRYTPLPLIQNSLEVFQASSVPLGLIPFTDDAMDLVADINQIRTKFVAKIVFGTYTVQKGLAAYAKEASKYNDFILRELNK